jgi:hypothetical protein
MSTTQLTATQYATLAHAIDAGDGRIDWFPENVNGGARVKVLAGLANRRLAIHQDGAWRATPAAYAALGRSEPAAPREDTTPDLEADVAAAEASVASAQRAPAPKSRRTRENTKQAALIAMLRHPEGATIAQLSSALGWQAHTVRGALAGALKKKLGLTLASEKVPGADRVYRIPGEAA